jgi:type I restriction enzyme S subunit
MAGEWPTVRIGDLGRVVTGRTPPGNDSRYYGDAVPFLTPSDFGDLRRVERPGRYLSLFGAGKLSRCTVAQGVGVSCIGWQMGRAVLLDRPTITNQQINSIVVDEKIADRAFVYYALRSRRKELFALGAGGSRTPILNKGDFERLPFVLPPLVQQRAIAHILGTLDDKIELNRQTHETLEAMARALFKSWFVDFDPVRAKAEGRQPSGMDAETANLFPSEFVESELGEIPKGWRCVRLTDVTSKIGSGATPRGGDKAYVEEGVTFIRSQNVYDSEFVWQGLVSITDDDARKLSGVTVQPEDVLLNITGASILRTCVVAPDVLPARVNQHVAIVRASDGVPPRFLSLHLLRSDTKNYLLGMDAGASRQAVTKGHIESVPLVLPSDSVLQRFRILTDPLFQAIGVNTKQGRSLAAIRDVILPRLLSGDLSVGGADDLNEAIAQ